MSRKCAMEDEVEITINFGEDKNFMAYAGQTHLNYGEKGRPASVEKNMAPLCGFDSYLSLFY